MPSACDYVLAGWLTQPAWKVQWLFGSRFPMQFIHVVQHITIGIVRFFFRRYYSRPNVIQFLITNHFVIEKLVHFSLKIENIQKKDFSVSVNLCLRCRRRSVIRRVVTVTDAHEFCDIDTIRSNPSICMGLHTSAYMQIDLRPCIDFLVPLLSVPLFFVCLLDLTNED